MDRLVLTQQVEEGIKQSLPPNETCLICLLVGFRLCFFFKLISNPEANDERHHNSNELPERHWVDAYKRGKSATNQRAHFCGELLFSRARAERLQGHNWIALWNTWLNYSVGYPLLSSLLQKFLSFPFLSLFSTPWGWQSLNNFVMLEGWGEGLGAVSSERFICLASGPNYLPCWALISVSEWRENNLYHSSSRLQAELWDCTQLCPSYSANLPLSSATGKMGCRATLRIGKHSQQNEKTAIGLVLSTQSSLGSNFHIITPC